MSIEKLGSSVYDSNSSNIVDSTRPGFVSTYQKGKKGTSEVSEDVSKDISSDRITEKFVKDTVEKTLKEKTTPQDEKAAADLIKNLMKKNLQNLKASDLMSPNMVFMRYSAKLADKIVFDKCPLAIILRSSRSRLLGLNLHWCPVPLRRILIKLIFKMNAKNIKQNKPFQLDYRTVKPLLSQLGLLNIVTTKIANGKRVSNSCIRQYIKNRIARRGLVIPPEYWLVAANLDASNFTDGYDPRNIFKKSVQNYKANRSKLYRNRKR